ncbi:two-component system, NtrC family, C4-dicarboxylate transport response regulator DctD [Pseudorhodobacter antarcticus]|jgi:two-component system C4-dicarboxylate transport response regulator DctD|uniref:Nif-specific regulatory protein n=1 Tax=Pseudorhodobacter antarcticus TaxID=1077947 RepID=A0A1H8MZB2_9RHOB|nr:sigma-54 dependent transcriptional regulator [Pseudorhodobacter antarcticus]SEO22609.1 two-component system, NtrC family, C4-dicarboxylate transport response regulator DctD [Pseudorhodobacter antarcticus]
MMGPVYVVDDDPDLRASTAQALDLAGLTPREFASAEDMADLVGFGFPGVVLTDIRMPGIDGLTLMNRIHAIDREVPVILMTGHGDLQLAVRAMREGAHDFIEKPFAAGQLTEILARALAYRRLVLENRTLRAAAGQVDDLEYRLAGRSNAMIDLRRRIRTLGPTEADVLIIGPTGAGKELAARALHDLSPRAAGPFVAIDCAALPADLIESELFGHEIGAFPSAVRARYGKFEHAQRGTVLLDDLGSMPLAVQAKLLRVIESRVVTRLGSNDTYPLDVRFMATSRADLHAEAAAGRFRDDLLYRLNVVTLHVPPLDARREDIGTLFLKLVDEAAGRHRRDAPPVPPLMIARLTSRDWPGNVRELRNAADRYVLGLETAGHPTDAPPQRLSDRVADFERREIESALSAHAGTLRAVYEGLGLSRKTLYEKMQKHGLSKSDFTDDGDTAPE